MRTLPENIYNRLNYFQDIAESITNQDIAESITNKVVQNTILTVYDILNKPKQNIIELLNSQLKKAGLNPIATNDNYAIEKTKVAA